VATWASSREVGCDIVENEIKKKEEEVKENLDQ